MLLLTVVLVMAAMMVASAMPAFAQGKGPGPCPPPGTDFSDEIAEGSVPPAFGTLQGEPFPTGIADICTDAPFVGPFR
jgi:hypothetical protein